MAVHHTLLKNSNGVSLSPGSVVVLGLAVTPLHDSISVLDMVLSIRMKGGTIPLLLRTDNVVRYVLLSASPA